VAGMINNCGILDWNQLPNDDAQWTAVNRAYKIYSRRVCFAVPWP
jgi:hypothetical protein